MRSDARTQLFGIIGNPVEHSLSPAMHNAAFEAMGMNAAYLAFRVEDACGALQGMRALGIRGLSVTVPHKVAVMMHLDRLDSLAEQIGAVNTVVNDGGRLIGHNTDASGAIKALKPHMDIKGARVLLVGAGGAARAIGYGLWSHGAKVTITNRTEEKGRELADELGAAFVPLSETGSFQADCIVQSTSVGMSPGPDRSPLPATVFRPGMVAMDTVYKPLKTRFLRDASERGCRCIDGLSMLLEQGVEQFRLWTGHEPRDVMARALKDALKETLNAG